MSRALITGLNGFLGSYVKKELLQKGIPFDHITRTTTNQKNEIQCDLSNSEPVLNKEYSTIVHIAGLAHMTPQNIDEENMFNQTNVIGTQNLLKAIVNKKEAIRSFVFISSVSVYGRSEGLDITEKESCTPDTPYGKSKLTAEKEIITWCSNHKIPYYILRLPLVVGYPCKGNLNQIINYISRGLYIKIYKNIALKSLVSAEDIAKLIISLEGKPCGIYNLSDGIPHRFMDIEKSIEKGLNKKVKIIVPKSMIKLVSLIGDVFNSIGIPFPLNSSKYRKMMSSLTFSNVLARNQLNWSPENTLDKLESILSKSSK